MSIKTLMEKIKNRGFVTPVTQQKTAEVTAKPAWIVARTPVTRVTPHLSDTCVNAQYGQFGDAVTDPAKPVTQTFMEHAGAWLELDQAYQLHHFKCQTCIAAGLGYGLRCGVGSALWITYQTNACQTNTGIL